jgi:hypothetical protein
MRPSQLTAHCWTTRTWNDTRDDLGTDSANQVLALLFPLLAKDSLAKQVQSGFQLLSVLDGSPYNGCRNCYLIEGSVPVKITIEYSSQFRRLLHDTLPVLA